jgi:type IV pilus assembly protein PilC
MPIYHYVGINYQGKKVKADFSCQDPIELKDELRKQNIILRSYTQAQEKRRSDFLAVSSRVKSSEFVTFCREFSIMLKAGASLSACLDTLRRQKFGTVFRNTISRVYEDVLKGEELSAALRKEKKAFPDFFISMVYVGEISGTLPTTLTKAADYYENSEKVKSETRTALVYPIFLLIVVLGVVILLMNVVIPEFKATLDELNATLPPITKGVIAVSDFFVAYWLWLIVGILSFILLLYLFNLTKEGKYARDWLTWNLPLSGQIKKATLVSVFCDSFGIMIASGLPVLDCMKAMPGIITNAYFNKKFKYATEEVNNGKRLSRALENTALFPPMLIEMVQVGEASPDLAGCFDAIGVYYETQQKNTVKRIVSVLEPVIILLLGALVLTIMLSVFLPMFEIYNSIDSSEQVSY